MPSFAADLPGPLLEGDEQIANEPAVDLVGEAAIDVELGLSRADKHFGFVQGMHVEKYAAAAQIILRAHLAA